MQYDPVKKIIGNLVGRHPFLRKLFYWWLNLLLLRSWHIRREIRNWAVSHRNSPVEVLDAGFGFGQYSYYLAKHFINWRITGIDIKQEQINDCNSFAGKLNLKNVSFEFGDLTSYRIPGKFRLILSVDVMEHIEDDMAVFSNFHASLQPGGLLLISTPSDKGGSDVKHPDQHSFIEEHVRDGYSVEEMRDKLEKAGFKNVVIRYQYGTPGKISWVLSMKIPMLLAGISKAFILLLPLYYVAVMPFCLLLNFADVNLVQTSGTGLIVKAWK